MRPVFLLFHISASFSLKLQCLNTGGMCCLGPLLASSRSSTAGFSSRSYDPHQRTGNEREADGERRACSPMHPFKPLSTMTFKALILATQTHHASHVSHTSHMTHSPPNLQSTSSPPGTVTHKVVGRHRTINTLFSKSTKEMLPVSALVQTKEATEQQCQNSAAVLGTMKGTYF